MSTDNYVHWSTHALFGYLVMTEALLSGTVTESRRADYFARIEAVNCELAARAGAFASRSLAFPSETLASGSSGT